MLLKFGADKNKPDRQRRTPLVLAIKWARTCPQVKGSSSDSNTTSTSFGAAKILLAACADTFGPGKPSALNVADRYGDVGLLTGMTQHQADVNATGSTSRTAQHEVADGITIGVRMDDVIEPLVGADVDIDVDA